MNKFINFKGRRIRKYHLHLKAWYTFMMMSPFIVFSIFWVYKSIYPLVMKQEINYQVYIMPGLVFLLSLLGGYILVKFIQYYFKWNGGYFIRVEQRQMLGKMIVADNLYTTKKKKRDGKLVEKVIFPKVYIKRTGKHKDFLDITVPLDGGKNHTKFNDKIGKTFEEMFLSDLVEEKRTLGFKTYSYLVDVIGNRINIKDVEVTKTSIKLMNGLLWDFASVPHALVTGGTGGGKSYFLYTLIFGFMQIGTVDICDPKRADLYDLGDLPAFKGHVFTGTEWIKRCLDNAVKEMNVRYEYMKTLPNYVTGQNYAYYDMFPHFVIVDEWAAFYGNLTYEEQDDITKFLKDLVMKGRQAGVFVIIATQRADASNFPGGIRDELSAKFSLGKLSPMGYKMTFGDENKNKAFYNKSIKGRGYASLNDIPVEHYAPLVDKSFNFMEEFKKFDTMKVQDFTLEDVN